MSDWSSPSPIWDTSNFGVNDKGRMCLLDFGEVGLLPESFVAYIVSLAAPFTAAVAQHLNWPSCSNLDMMSKIHGCLVMLAYPTLGTSTCNLHDIGV